MLSNHLSQFLRDERGSYTLWSLVWFILYVGIGGLAVDMTDGYRNQTLLQSTADAAALAGVMSLPDQADAVVQALDYAADNMAQDTHGVVLTAQDVMVGTWYFDSETFKPNTAEPNAVYVTTRRGVQNGNPVIMSFLRIAQLWGFDAWMNVNAEAVAVRGHHLCRNNGIIAGGDFTVTTHIDFLNNICLIGHTKFWFRPDVTFDTGVYVGVGCTADTNQCIGPGGAQQFSNGGFRAAFGMDSGAAHYEDMTPPTMAEMTDFFTDMVINMAKAGNAGVSYDQFIAPLELQFKGIDFDGYKYLADPGSNIIKYDTLAALPSDPQELSSYTVYEYTGSCGGKGITLPEGTYQNLAIITDCQINLPSNSNFTMSNTLLASRNTGKYGVKAPGQVNFGAMDCDAGVEIYSYGEVQMAAAADIANLRILAMDDVQFAAQADAHVGIHIETTGEFRTASGGGANANGNANGVGEDSGDFGLCPNSLTNGPRLYTYSLVR